jgi:hypothetical protein
MLLTRIDRKETPLIKVLGGVSSFQALILSSFDTCGSLGRQYYESDSKVTPTDPSVRSTHPLFGRAIFFQFFV